MVGEQVKFSPAGHMWQLDSYHSVGKYVSTEFMAYPYLQKKFNLNQSSE
jgi:hypothetical protein